MCQQRSEIELQILGLTRLAAYSLNSTGILPTIRPFGSLVMLQEQLAFRRKGQIPQVNLNKGLGPGPPNCWQMVCGMTSQMAVLGLSCQPLGGPGGCFPFFSTLVLFNNQPLSLGFRRFSRKKYPWRERKWKVPLDKDVLGWPACQRWIRCWIRQSLRKLAGVISRVQGSPQRKPKAGWCLKSVIPCLISAEHQPENGLPTLALATHRDSGFGYPPARLKAPL